MATQIGTETNELELTATEAGRLEELEGVITKVFVGFYVMGEALDEIDTKRLYRVTHVTFKDYCRERFEVSRQSAYQYIEAKKIMDILSAIGGQTNLLPLNERQVRPLTRLKPDLQAEAWEKVVEMAPAEGVTAKFVAEVVDGIIGKEVKKKAEKIKKEMESAVSDSFHNALWALINVVRDEVRWPLKAKRRKVMIKAVQSVERLLAE